MIALNLLGSLLGCMTLDPFFFNPTETSQYGFPSDVIPADALEEVAFESGDGTHLYGLWIASERPARDPVVVYFHGNSGNLDTNMSQVEALYGLDVNIFTVDYRGYGRSEGSPSHDGLIQDGIAAVDYATERSGKDSSELGYVGLSLGGFVGLHVASERPPATVVTHDLFASAQDMLGDNTGLDVPAGWLFDSGFDNLEAAAALEVPYFITHGAEDDYINPECAYRLYDAATVEDKDLWMVPQGTHGWTHVDQPELYQAKVGAWLDDHL